MLGQNKYLTEFVARNKPLLASNFDAITRSAPLLVPASISKNFTDAKIISSFRLSHYIELNSTSAKPRFFGVAKRYLGVIILLPYP